MECHFTSPVSSPLLLSPLSPYSARTRTHTHTQEERASASSQGGGCMNGRARPATCQAGGGAGGGADAMRELSEDTLAESDMFASAAPPALPPSSPKDLGVLFRLPPPLTPTPNTFSAPRAPSRAPAPHTRSALLSGDVTIEGESTGDGESCNVTREGAGETCACNTALSVSPGSLTPLRG
jgi:hypothetical protein